MKQLLTTVAFAVVAIAFARPAPASLLLYEGFNYDGVIANGGNMDNGVDDTLATGGSGWTGGWDSPGTIPLKYSSTGLTYSNAGTLQTIGGKMIDLSTGGPNWSETRQIATTLDPDGTYWFSYLVASLDTAGSPLGETNNYTMIGSNSNSNNTGFGSQMGAAGNDDSIGARINGTNDTTSLPTHTQDGSGALVVGKVVLSTTVADVVSIWVNIPLTTTEGTIGAAQSDVSGTATLGSYFTYLVFPNSNGTTMIDEIRLGTSLADVIPTVGGGDVPTPAALPAGLFLLSLTLARRKRA